MNSESFPMNMKIREFTLNIIFVISIFSVYFPIFYIQRKIPRIFLLEWQNEAQKSKIKNSRNSP